MPANDRPPAIDWFVTDPVRVVLRQRARDARVAADLFLHPGARLRDDDRAVIAGLLTALVDRIERDLRTRLVVPGAEDAPLAGAFAAPGAVVARPMLERAGLLCDPALVAVLAQRAGERRLVSRLRLDRRRAAAIEPAPPSPTASLADDADATVAAAARALAAVDRDDAVADDRPLLPADVQHRLVWRIAAALRHHAITRHALSGTAVDPSIARAAGAVLAGYDEGATPAGLALGLARALAAAGRLDGMRAADALAAGEVGLAVAVLAVRGGIGFAPAWDMLLDPDPSRLLLLCRAAGLSPAATADIALRLATGEDDDMLADRLETVAALAPSAATAAIGPWRLDPAYLDAIAEMAGGRLP